MPLDNPKDENSALITPKDKANRGRCRSCGRPSAQVRKRQNQNCARCNR